MATIKTLLKNSQISFDIGEKNGDKNRNLFWFTYGITNHFAYSGWNPADLNAVLGFLSPTFGYPKANSV